jgi:hypothetical protein
MYLCIKAVGKGGEGRMGLKPPPKKKISLIFTCISVGATSPPPLVRIFLDDSASTDFFLDDLAPSPEDKSCLRPCCVCVCLPAVWVSLGVCVWVCVCVWLCACICLCMCLFACIFVSVYQVGSGSVSGSESVSLSPSVSVSLYVSVSEPRSRSVSASAV